MNHPHWALLVMLSFGASVASPTPPADAQSTGVLSTGVEASALETTTVDSPSFEDWTWTLDRFVDAEGRVDYTGLRADRERLDRFVAQVGRLSPARHPEAFPDRDAALGYLIDAYNALVFASVLDLAPNVDSVWGKSGTGYGFFVRRKVRIGGELMSLKRLEDELIRETYRDPRIHAALNCASNGCPRLPNEAFSIQPLASRLDSAMREFVADERHCRVDASARTVTLSKIFDWFAKDFLTDVRSHRGSVRGLPTPILLDYVNRYRASDAQIPRGYKIRFARYDKGLNRQIEPEDS